MAIRARMTQACTVKLAAIALQVVLHDTSQDGLPAAFLHMCPAALQLLVSSLLQDQRDDLPSR